MASRRGRAGFSRGAIVATVLTLLYLFTVKPTQPEQHCMIAAVCIHANPRHSMLMVQIAWEPRCTCTYEYFRIRRTAYCIECIMMSLMRAVLRIVSGFRSDSVSILWTNSCPCGKAIAASTSREVTCNRESGLAHCFVLSNAYQV